MRVSELYDSHFLFKNAEVTVIGAGPSVSVFPKRFLIKCVYKQPVVFLNETWKDFLDITNGIQEAIFANNRKFLKGCSSGIKIVKCRNKFEPGFERDDNHVPWDDPCFYCFSYRDRRHDEWDHFDEEALWKEPDYYWNTPGGNVCIFALQFLLLAGAARINLIGCDATPLGGDRYYQGHSFARGRGQKYDAYAAGMLRMIREGRERFGVPIVTISPFAGLGREQDQYEEMLTWKS